jgi:hypothetical protein
MAARQLGQGEGGREMVRGGRRRAAAVLASAAVLGSVAVLAPARAATGAPAANAVALTSPSPATPKYYVVGRGEVLFRIAARTLGDGKRFLEIYELNRGRTQADGRAMTDPATLRPGWVLQLPADATGPGVLDEPPAADPSPGPSPRPSTGPSGGPAADSGEPGRGASPVLLSVSAVSAGVLLVAGLAVAGRRGAFRRRARPPASDIAVAPEVAVAPDIAVVPDVAVDQGDLSQVDTRFVAKIPLINGMGEGGRKVGAIR